MKITDLKADLEKSDITYRGICHDCKTPVAVTAKVTEEGEIEISGGALYKVKQGYEDALFFKCDACFVKDPILRNFKECEVFSRAVGYLRPVKQWNKGKREEFKMRKEFVNTKGL